MKSLKIYKVDAFSNGPFTGNPAGVVPLRDEWLDETLMQNIAMENNLPETAFVLNTGGTWNIRWFTPAVEVELCGHATLASAHVLFKHEGFEGMEICFKSLSGDLFVRRSTELLTLNFPTDTISRVPVTDKMGKCFGVIPLEAWKGKTDFMLVFEKESQIAGLRPSNDDIMQFNGRGVIATAQGDKVDFVSRFFAPQSGVPEDPVTGSAHTTLTPYWSSRLNKRKLTAMQLSARKGWLYCENLGDRTEISGRAITYLKGEIIID
ncbi:MAG: PhzF family phenazine biosynthesis protein [Bacteroidetes bacterium]|nr:PhzF family phenazine biosynthesis protein [Bacteroidota bacterium]